MSNSEPVKGTSNLVLATFNKASMKERSKHRRTPEKMRKEVFQASREGQHTNPWDTQMKMVEVESNYARDRVVMISGSDLILHFDHQGRAWMPEHKLPLLKAEMRVRPGRYKIVEKEAELPVADAADNETAVAMKEQVEALLESISKEEDEDEDQPEVTVEWPKDEDGDKLELYSELTEDE